MSDPVRSSDPGRELREHGLVTARELLERERDAARGERDESRGLEGLLRRGSFVEMVGRPSSGRTSLVLRELGRVTGVGEGAVLVDLGDGLDPRSATAAGIDPRCMLWIRPVDLQSALAATELVLPAGLPLVVLDLGLAPIPGRREFERSGARVTKGPAASWARLARGAAEHDVALLLSSPYRISGAAARAVVEVHRSRTLWTPGDPLVFEGIEAELVQRKNRRDGGHGKGRASLGALRFSTPWSLPIPPE